MSRRHKIALAVCLFLFTAKLAGAQDVESVRADLETLRNRIDAIEADLKAEVIRRDSLQAKLAAAEAAVGQAARRLIEVEQALKAVDARLAALETEQTVLRQAHEAEQEKLAAGVRAAWLMGREAKLKLLLNQEDLAAGARLMAYFRYLQQARLDHIALIKSQLEQLARIEREITREQARLAALQQERSLQLANEEQALARRADVMARIEERIQSRGRQLSGLTRDEAALEALLARLERALASIDDIPAKMSVPFSQLKGQLPWPLAEAARIDPEDQGFLLTADSGAPVHAIAAGRVAFADWLRGYGLLLILDHGDGYMSLYAHNHSLLRDVGEWVSAGTVIAQVGNSGGRDQAGLYFELRHEAEPVSVLTWLGSR